MENYKNPQNEANKLSEKKEKFTNALHEVNHTIDKLGLGIDEDIKETVALLRTMGFPTSSSCAGHAEKGKIAIPYIEVYAKAPEGWKDDKAKQGEWRIENEGYQKQMAEVLQQFYTDRLIPTRDIMINIQKMGIFGGFRINSMGKGDPSELGIKTEEEMIEKIKQYQNEMTVFTEFLKQNILRD